MNAPRKIPRSAAPATGKVLDCAGRIVALINSGKLDPRRRIGESSLALRFKISRTAVRSALEHLEIAGLVERRPRAGTFLRQITVAEFCDAMDIRAALEGLAAGQAALRVGKGALRDLGRLADKVDKLNVRLLKGESEVRSELTRQDLEFHLDLAALSGNSRLAGTLHQQRLIEFTFGLAARAAVGRPRRDWLIPTHREIVEAVASGNPKQAARMARKHILRTKETL